MKYITLKIFFLAFVVTSALNISFAISQPKDKLKIGALLCQTGNCADWGTAALKGAELAVEKTNVHGGVLSKEIELVVEDSADSISGARAITAFQSLHSRNFKFYIGPSWAPAALSVAPVVAKLSDIIIITPSASAREFSRSASHIFNMRPPEELATRALARHAFNRGMRRAAIFSSQQPAESTQGKIFEDEFKKLGGEVTIRLEAIPTQLDLRAEALKIVTTSPDVVFIINYNQMETGIKELNKLGSKSMRMTISLDDARIASAKGLLEGIIIGRAAEPTEEFRNEFQKKFGEVPGLSAEGGYDAVMSLVQAIKESGNLNVSRIREKLQHGKYLGAIGEFTFDENREVVQAPLLFVVKNGKLVLLTE